MRKSLTLLALIISGCQLVLAQKVDSNIVKRQAVTKTGISYEALAKFLQANVSTGKDGGYDLKTTLFSLKRLFSGRDLTLSDYYGSDQGARNFEINPGLHKGVSGDPNVAALALKYALVNHRDRSRINFSNILRGAIINFGRQQDRARRQDSLFLSSISDTVVRARLEKDLLDSLALFSNSDQDFRFMPKRMLDSLDSFFLQQNNMKAEDFFKQMLQKIYDNAAQKIDQGALITLNAGSGYDFGSKEYSTSVVGLRYLQGLGKNAAKPLDLDIQALYQWENDSTGKLGNLGRSFFTGSLGANKALFLTKDNNPLVEFELAAEYDYIANGRYDMEDKNKIKAVGTLRVHVTKEISIPVTFKYDPVNPNLAGFIRVQWNLENSK